MIVLVDRRKLDPWLSAADMCLPALCGIDIGYAGAGEAHVCMGQRLTFVCCIAKWRCRAIAKRGACRHTCACQTEERWCLGGTYHLYHS